jgi:hypothetical protein
VAGVEPNSKYWEGDRVEGEGRRERVRLQARSVTRAAYTALNILSHTLCLPQSRIHLTALAPWRSLIAPNDRRRRI